MIDNVTARIYRMGTPDTLIKTELIVTSSAWNLSKKQYSNTLHNIGVVAMPLKSSHIMALIRVSLGFGMGFYNSSSG